MNSFKNPLKLKLNQNTEGSIKLIEQFRYRLDIKLYANVGSQLNTRLASPLFTQLFVRINNELKNELKKVT